MKQDLWEEIEGHKSTELVLLIRTGLLQKHHKECKVKEQNIGQYTERVILQSPSHPPTQLTQSKLGNEFCPLGSGVVIFGVIQILTARVKIILLDHLSTPDSQSDQLLRLKRLQDHGVVQESHCQNNPI